MMNSEALTHLSRLLDDPDESVWTAIRQSLLQKLSQDDLPALQDEWQRSDNPVVAERLEYLIRDLGIQALHRDFQIYLNNPKAGLFQGLVLVTRILIPDFSEQDLTNLLQPLKQRIWIELNERLTALEKVRVMNHLLFEKSQLTRKSALESRSIHLFIPNLLKTKTGHGLSIASLFILLSRMLELPVYKVSRGDIPAMAYLDTQGRKIPDPASLSAFQVLFYLILDQELEVYGKNQFAEYIRHLYPTGDQDQEVVGDRFLIKALLTRLKFMYQDEKNTFRKEQMINLLSLFR